MTTWWDNAQSQTEVTWTCRNISLSTSKVHIRFFFSLLFFCPHSLFHTHSCTAVNPFFLDDQYKREKTCHGSDPGPWFETTSVSFSSDAVFFFHLCFSVCLWMSVWVHLPWECLHWKHVAKRKEVVKLKPSVVRRWAEVPLPAAMNGSFRRKCTVAGRAAPYPPKEERWKCVRERG